MAEYKYVLQECSVIKPELLFFKMCLSFQFHQHTCFQTYTDIKSNISFFQFLN